MGGVAVKLLSEHERILSHTLKQLVQGDRARLCVRRTYAELPGILGCYKPSSPALLRRSHPFQLRCKLASMKNESAPNCSSVSPLRETTGTVWARKSRFPPAWAAGIARYPFRLGERYLVYAHTNEETEKLGTSICTLTKLLSDAKEDLEYISVLSTEPAGTRFFGSVLDYTASRLRTQASRENLAGADIRLKGPQGVQHVCQRKSAPASAGRVGGSRGKWLGRTSSRNGQRRRMANLLRTRAFRLLTQTTRGAQTRVRDRTPRENFQPRCLQTCEPCFGYRCRMQLGCG